MDVDEKISYIEVADIYVWAQFDAYPIKNQDQT